MRQAIKTICVPIVLALLSSHCGFHKKPVKVLPDAQKEKQRILFIAFDGISYDMMHALKQEGYFKDFADPIPLISTFPSATTTGFTGIFKPLHGGTVPGYETRFYSFEKNRVIGGTPWDIYKIDVNYKTYFDAFRHTMLEKSVMYSFPGVAGKQDLMRTEKLLRTSDKKILFTYLGGTDGAQHILGEKRTKRFMIFVDEFLYRMKKRDEKKNSSPLQLVLFSDHGFHYDKLTMVGSSKFQKSLNGVGILLGHRLKGKNSALLVKYGLLSAGVMMTDPGLEEKAARAIHQIEGLDLVFWSKKNRIYVLSSLGEEAYFEYQDPSFYRYVGVRGDPLDYEPVLKKAGRKLGEYLKDKTWFELTARHDYPDAGYRLNDAFHELVENKASVMFSLKPDYQFGGLAALAGTKLKWGGHKGTHGGLFRDTSHAFVMTNSMSQLQPAALRYDELFKFFLPRVVEAYKKTKTEIQVLVQPHNDDP